MLGQHLRMITEIGEFSQNNIYDKKYKENNVSF